MKEKLMAVGVEYDEVLKRFMGKEDFYLRMLKKFVDDKNYGGLQQAVADKNWKEAFTYAHTVKGLCGNLGLGGILDYVGPLTEELRNGPYDEESIAHHMRHATKAYDKTVEVIKEL
ncbi:MAG: Hpt domain-containing protein [Lachnospiraceae bacterium]|nr:Hpt domain-containing protein [Lachnospiraceae bacterium]